MIKLIAVGLLLVVAAGMLYIRFSPNDPARWHLDPQLAARPASPNYHLIRAVGGDAIAPFFPLAPSELAVRIDRIARADGAGLLAGSVADGHMTYVSRTPLMGYPDMTSVKVIPAGSGATFTALARARFGQRDHGVNRARLRRWIAALERELGGQGT